ncbi:NgoFVII family restriction endonuclease [Sutcliffiella horikoshii]|uniref:DUF881 domain-containing protein n=1 Tax=Sutcliffiella horikoshii TaxID=79883 RepID=A0A1Y0CLV6_9BACI|nr:DUF881 domain-containing protein [Sutcliffiella horikoshii]ART76261.1 NgoFVII family restriction endonuclease [Sutcliffiella horikoshii]TYS61520.1 DUF881 domain-containing protein [Sutcliffiella horikoshii]
MDKRKFSFTIITIIVGLMIAIQFQTVQQPIIRDTRDTWQLRSDLNQEQEIQSQIIKEIRKYDKILEDYSKERDESKETIVRETLEELKVKAGLTEMKGPGIKLTVKPLFDEDVLGNIQENISADLLRRFVNELNSYGVEEISIANQRIVSNTIIREINGRTKVNNAWIPNANFEIIVITSDPTKLYNRLQVSRAMDEFAIENLLLEVSTPINEVTVPAYDEQIRVKHLEPVKTGKEGN